MSRNSFMDNKYLQTTFYFIKMAHLNKLIVQLN